MDFKGLQKWFAHMESQAEKSVNALEQVMTWEENEKWLQTAREMLISSSGGTQGGSVFITALCLLPGALGASLL